MGETVVDTNFRSRHEPNVDIALDADERTFVALLLETFARNVLDEATDSPGAA
jgi:hypothetical protein